MFPNSASFFFFFFFLSLFPLLLLYPFSSPHPPFLFLFFLSEGWVVDRYLIVKDINASLFWVIDLRGYWQSHCVRVDHVNVQQHRKRVWLWCLCFLFITFSPFCFVACLLLLFLLLIWHHERGLGLLTGISDSGAHLFYFFKIYLLSLLFINIMASVASLYIYA